VIHGHVTDSLAERYCGRLLLCFVRTWPARAVCGSGHTAYASEILLTNNHHGDAGGYSLA
jgi:hypothetical protein